MLDLQVKLHQNPQVVIENLGEEAVAYQPSGRDVHALNATALHVWRLCDGRNSLADIVAQIQRDYSQTEASDVGSDVRRVVQEMIDLGLLVQ